MALNRVVAGLLVGLALVALTALPACAEPQETPGEELSEVGQEIRHDVDEELTHGGHAGQGGEVNTNPMEFTPDLAIFTGIIFLVLMAVLWKFAWGPISQGLQRREQGIADQIAQAEEANTKARELLSEYEQKLAASQEEVRAIIAQGRQDAEKVGREMVDKAKAEADTERRRALDQIDNATTMALKELADKSATLAVDLAGKIVGAQLNAADHARLIDRAVSGFTAGEPSEN